MYSHIIIYIYIYIYIIILVFNICIDHIIQYCNNTTLVILHSIVIIIYSCMIVVKCIYITYILIYNC